MITAELEPKWQSQGSKGRNCQPPETSKRIVVLGVTLGVMVQTARMAKRLWPVKDATIAEL